MKRARLLAGVFNARAKASGCFTSVKWNCRLSKKQKPRIATSESAVHAMIQPRRRTQGTWARLLKRASVRKIGAVMETTMWKAVKPKVQTQLTPQARPYTLEKPVSVQLGLKKLLQVIPSSTMA